ncbi:MAG: hypothetical protein ACXWCZ_01275 [Flavisolibacter sp.]
MEEDFELPVMHKGKEIIYSARLLTLGYIYKIEVEIHGVLVHFEKDDERNWRAILADTTTNFEKSINKELMSDVIAAIEELIDS